MTWCRRLVPSPARPAPPPTRARGVGLDGAVLGVVGAFAQLQQLRIEEPFLGLGVRPPEPEWGLMLNTLRTAIYVNPMVAALPGLAIFIVSISFNLFSDGLRSAMEVKQ